MPLSRERMREYMRKRRGLQGCVNQGCKPVNHKSVNQEFVNPVNLCKPDDVNHEDNVIELKTRGVRDVSGMKSVKGLVELIDRLQNNNVVVLDRFVRKAISLCEHGSARGLCKHGCK